MASDPLKEANMTLRTLLLSATALTGFVQIAAAGDLSFTAVAMPTDDAAKRQVVATAQAMMDGTACLLYTSRCV